MKNAALVITSIASSSHPVLKSYATQSMERQIPFIVVGDTKSPPDFDLPGCDYYSIARQEEAGFELSKSLPKKHYARKNLGYLIAIRGGAEILIETDDDNLPLDGFWDTRSRSVTACLIEDTSWTNVYKYFSTANIWPRGFALERLLDPVPALPTHRQLVCPVQQGLADDNPDVDAIFRLTQPLPLKFDHGPSVAIGKNAICPFNSQNTTWFKEAFPLLYLPSFCSFRMTDIWRSFVAQRILWTCDWATMFHSSTVRQDRNEHNLMADFRDEISGYNANLSIMEALSALDLLPGKDAMCRNLLACYEKLVQMGLVGEGELPLVRAWISDIDKLA